MNTRTQIFSLTILALSVIGIVPPTPGDLGTSTRSTTSCITWYKPALHLRPTPRRPIILTPPCLPWRDPLTPKPVMRFF